MVDQGEVYMVQVNVHPFAKELYTCYKGLMKHITQKFLKTLIAEKAPFSCQFLNIGFVGFLP